MSNTSIYPNAIDGYAQLPIAVDGITEINAFSVNTLRSAIYNIEVELGVLPSGSSTSVSERLDTIQDALDAVEEALDTIYQRPPLSHASTHISGGSDEIDGDNLSVNYGPTNYSADDEELSDHLEGIDIKLGANAEDLIAAAEKFTSRLDKMIFHLEIITGTELDVAEDPIGKLDDIILLFSLITEA